MAHLLRFFRRLRYRPTDLIALALVVTACTARAHHLLGVRDQWLLVIFVVTWLASAVKRLVDFRRGVYSPLNAHGQPGRAIPVVIASTGLWIALGFSYMAYPGSFVWMSGSLPVWLKVMGVALAVIALVRPPVLSFDNELHSSGLFVPPFTVHAQIVTLAMLLMSGSLVIGLVTSVWLLMLYGTTPQTSSPHVELSGLTIGRLEVAMGTIKSS